MRRRKRNKDLPIPSDQLLVAFLEHHRSYLARNWQFFGAVLLIESVVLNAYSELNAMGALGAVIPPAAIALTGIFYHLMNWTNMRIDRHNKRINRLWNTDIIEVPKHKWEGMIIWMKAGVIALAAPYLVLALGSTEWSRCLGVVAFFGIPVVSELIVWNADQREIPLPRLPPAETNVKVSMVEST